MRRRARLGLGAAVAALAWLLVVPASALAYAPTGDDFITCTADGTTADGEVAFVFDVPADHGDGDVTVTLRCEEGETKVLSDVIASVQDGEVIAVTGLDTLKVLGLGGLTLVLGAAILAVSRSGLAGSRTGRDTTT